MVPMWIKWLQPWLLLVTTATIARPACSHVLLNYPASPSYVQTQGLVPITPSHTAYATRTIGVPVLSSQSSFFLKSIPPLLTPVVTTTVPATPTVVTSAVPATPAVVTSAVPATPAVAPALPAAPAAPAASVPLPTSPSQAVPTYVVYSDGTVIPLADTHYQFPPVIEGIINRVQNYFSNYVHVDPHLLPFPVQNQQNNKGQKLTNKDNSSNAGVPTISKTSGNAINQRLLALSLGQLPLGANIAFTRSSTVPTSSGRTAKLIEVFRPSGNGLAGTFRPVEGNDRSRYAEGPNSEGVGNNAPPYDNRPSEQGPDNNQLPSGENYPQNGDRPQGADSRPSDNRPRPPRPGQGRPDASPPNGYRYDRPLRPLEYDIPPKPEAYRSSGPY